MISTKVFRASKLAATLHLDQKRKDGSPYVNHLFSVALIVARYSNDDELIAAALLHDVIEDVPKAVYSENQLKDDFGERIYNIILNLSHSHDPMPDAELTITWEARKTSALEHMKSFDLDSLLVKCADKIQNIYDMCQALEERGEIMWQDFHASKEDEIRFHEACSRIINERMPGAAAQELQYYVEKLKTLSGRQSA